MILNMVHKESLTKKILEILVGLTETSFYLFVAIVESGYGASQKQMERKFWELQERGLSKKHPDDFLKRRNNFYSMLSQLKKDGLIQQKNGKWSTTALGRKKHQSMLDRLPIKKYESKPDLTLKIIIFDIPEKEKHKRDWLRSRLKGMGFKKLQKSVWVGKFKLPEDFLEDLRDAKLIEYVEIFAVTKSGSLRPIV
ncbi:MAG: hypothetical protein HYW38_02330 [Candidatus Colwellbacteria bacterium]|nr:hypothetical protein [Candidatus Colwellbacteria bacterium]